ncbi:MAG: DUF4325 domain-containing protein [Cyanobacteria bacterium P01_D01_bin.156]
MAKKIRKRSELIRQFILNNVNEYPEQIAVLAADEFGITRQAINKHIKQLIEQKLVVVEGSTRSKRYYLRSQSAWLKNYALDPDLTEDIVWDVDIRPLVVNLPGNVKDIWWYGFSEMFNNAIDHSSGKTITVKVEKTATDTEIIISDDGEGIFKKIQRELNLHDQRHSVLELAKGKLTTDPKRHSGQGIFFTSRMFDSFAILSGIVYFSHEFNKVEDWIFENDTGQSSTTVFMKLSNTTSRTDRKIFDLFSSGDDYAFTKTVVPVRLTQYGDEKLVSRSQAKRLLARVNKFKVVVFDFSEVDSIGQAFADEVFRVFRKQYPDIDIKSINQNKYVMQMIRRAESNDI